MNIVITGGTKGIGKAIAELFARKGFNIALCARTTADLNAVQKELKSANSEIQIIAEKVDMSIRNQVEAFAEKVIKKWGNIEVLINNAAAFIQGSFLEEPDDLLENMMATNVLGSYYLTKKLLPGMISSETGHIFNICSIASEKAYPGCSSYVVTKHALLGFSRALRLELMDKKIKVTSVMPGATLTNSWAGVKLPKGRIMAAEDVAKTVWAAYDTGPSATIEEIVMRPQLGDL